MRDAAADAMLTRLRLMPTPPRLSAEMPPIRGPPSYECRRRAHAPRAPSAAAADDDERAAESRRDAER